MQKITKKEFVSLGKEGFYYVGASWRNKELTINALKLVIGSNLEVSYRQLTNSTQSSLKFSRGDGTYSYLSISGSNCTIYREGNFILVEDFYPSNKAYNTTVYYLKEK